MATRSEEVEMTPSGILLLVIEVFLFKLVKSKVLDDDLKSSDSLG